MKHFPNVLIYLDYIFAEVLIEKHRVRGVFVSQQELVRFIDLRQTLSRPPLFLLSEF